MTIKIGCVVEMKFENVPNMVGVVCEDTDGYFDIIWFDGSVSYNVKESDLIWISSNLNDYELSQQPSWSE
jgi:hypothetical protein